MARFNPIFNSLVAGEWSPLLDGRDDLAGYQHSLRQSQNGITLPQGGWTHRPGTEFISEVKDSADATRLIPFVFSVDTAYVIEVGDLYMRFYSGGGQVQSGGGFADGGLFDDGAGFSDVGTAIEITSPYSSSQIANIQWAQVGDVLYLVHPLHPIYTLTREDSITFTLAELEYTDGKAPLLADNLSTTTLTVTGAGPTYTVTASAATFSTSTDVGRAIRIRIGGTDGRYEITAVTSSLIASATLTDGTDHSGAGATDDWALGMSSDNQGFRSITFHENRLWLGGCARAKERIVSSDSGIFNQFTYGAANDTDAIYLNASSAAGLATIQWLSSTEKALWVGTYSNEGVIDPAEDKILTPASARYLPRTLRGSDHTMPAIVGNDLTYIQRGGTKLRRLTFELAADRYNANEVSILAEHILQLGCSEIVYQQTPHSVLWGVLDDGTLLGFTMEPEQEVVGAHRHVLGGVYDVGGNAARVESLCVIPNSPRDELWMIVNRYIDGGTKRYVELMRPRFSPNLSRKATYLQRVNGLDGHWFVDSGLELNNPVAISGISQASQGVITTSASHNLSDDDYVLVRDVQGMTEVARQQYQVEVITSTTFYIRDEDGNYVDTTGFTAYTQGGTIRKMVETVSGLSHLEGQTVKVVADGASHPDRTVSSGAITLQGRAGRVLVGLYTKAFFETQRATGGGRIGSDQGQKARVPLLSMRVHDSTVFSAGTGPDPSSELLEPHDTREGEWEYDAPPPLYSGDVELPIAAEWNTAPTVYVEVDEPFPFTALAIMPRAESHER